MALNSKVKFAVFVPVLLISFFFFFLPIVDTFSSSMKDLSGNFIGLERYFEFLSRTEFINSFVRTLEFTLCAVILSAVLATIIALALRGTFIGKRLSLFLFQTNISIPHIAVAMMVIFLLSGTGFFSSIFYNLGIIDNWYEFPKIVGDASIVGIVISYTLKFTPFMGLSILAVLQSLPMDYEQQSNVLGVNKIKTFIHITLPAILPAIVTTGLFSFTFAFGCYEVPMMLLSGDSLSTMIYNDYYNYSDPEGMYNAFTGGIILTVISVAISAAVLYLTMGQEDKDE